MVSSDVALPNDERLLTHWLLDKARPIPFVKTLLEELLCWLDAVSHEFEDDIQKILSKPEQSSWRGGEGILPQQESREI